MAEADEAPALPPAVVPGAELMVARAVARRSGRPVFAVRDPETGARRLVGEPPREAARSSTTASRCRLLENSLRSNLLNLNFAIWMI